MSDQRARALRLLGEDEAPPVAMFKTSLRNWQAQWKAKQTDTSPTEGSNSAPAGNGARLHNRSSRLGLRPRSHKNNRNSAR
jgi:hypothetical protein